ncbi:MAG: SLBB domain-containing protein [Candidatus Cloacimonetes bacterium]|nr:SLBB domain-containing protein [Candidatus Cloacimonadota bacterium]
MKKMYKPLIFVVVLLISLNLTAQQLDISQYKNSDLMYHVSVVGAIKNPGVYPVLPTNRVTEAIKIANALLDTLNAPIHKGEQISRRNVILKREGKKIELDLLRFLILGEEKSNPYLKDGDIIIVPTMKEQVHIFGAFANQTEVNLKNTMELRAGDRVSDIIELAMGILPSADQTNADVVRFIGNTSKTENIELVLGDILTNPNSEANILLKHDDRIYIRDIPHYHNKSYITLVGEVAYEGTYAIERNKTTLLQIINKAGGPTEDADLTNAYLKRYSVEDLREPKFNKLRNTNTRDMSILDYRYYRNKLTEENGVFAKNFDLLWNDQNSELDIALKDRDVIFIPAKSVTVKISGEVENPGIISYNNEINYLDYIKLAGGFTNKAWQSKIKVIRAKTGEWVDPNKNTMIYPGDTIYIPRKERFSYYWPYIQETIAFITGLATSIIVIRSLITN